MTDTDTQPTGLDVQRVVTAENMCSRGSHLLQSEMPPTEEMDMTEWAELTQPERDEQLRITREILDELMAEEKVRKAAIKAAKDAANDDAIRDLNDHLPCRVEVVTHETDEDWEAGGPCDLGRIGWVRTHTQAPAWVYVEGMNSDDGLDDGNPTRIQEPRHIRRLP